MTIKDRWAHSRADFYAEQLRAGMTNPWLVYEYAKNRYLASWQGTSIHLDDMCHRVYRKFYGHVPVRVIREGLQEFRQWYRSNHESREGA